MTDLNLLAWAIGRGVYTVSRFVSDQLAIDCHGKLRWPLGWEPTP